MVKGELAGQLSTLQHGDHVCLFCDDRKAARLLTARFLHDGLQRGECCVFLAGEQHLRELAADLAQLGADWSGLERAGALLLPERNVALPHDRFDPASLLGFLERVRDEALRKGFAAFRLVGEMVWMLGAGLNGAALLRYEALLSRFLRHGRTVALCEYDRRQLSSDVVRGALRTHPLAIIKEQLCRNLFCEPSDFVLATAQDGEHVDWMLRQLLEAQLQSNHRQHAEQALQASEAKLRHVTDHVPVYIARCGRDHRFVFVNRPYAQRFGLAPEEVIGKPVDEILGTSAYETILPYIERVLAGEGIEYELELTYRHIGRRFVRCVYAPERDLAGNVVGWLSVVSDITERRRAEEALRVSESRYRAVVESQAEMVCRFAPDGTILFVNGAYARARGTTPEALLGTNWWRFVAEEDRPTVQAMLDQLTPDSPETRIENRFRTAEGEIWTLWTNRALAFDANGRWTEAQSAGIDITQRKRAEETVRALLRISERLNATLDVDELLDILVQEAIDLADAESGTSGLQTPQGMVCKRYFQQGKVLQLDYCFPPLHGLPGWILVHKVPYLTNDADADPQIVPALRTQFGVRSALSTPIITPQGEVLGFFEIHNKRAEHGFTDADEQKLLAVSQIAAIAVQNALAYRARQEAERSLMEADRRKNEFLATLAHELRNPLAPISNALQLIRCAGDNEPIREQAADMMERQVGQMVRLIDDLLDLSRITRNKLELRKEWIELAVVIQSAVETARPLIEAEGHALSISLPAEPILLYADLTRLAQIFSNLLTNAAKYTPPGGLIQIRGERCDDHLVVRVRDNGIGIAADKLQYVFDMFVQIDRSLEKSQGGLGVGLTLVKRLVELHGGMVEARSDGAGQGSEFSVRLPLMPASALHPVTPAQVHRDGQLHSRILVVDDNVDSAESLALYLRIRGAEVRTAHDGCAAIEAWREFRPRVVLMDIGMPRLNGYDAARQIRQHPEFDGTLLIAMTGWGQDDDKRRAAEAGFFAHLTKPVDTAALETLLHHAEGTALAPRDGKTDDHGRMSLFP